MKSQRSWQGLISGRKAAKVTPGPAPSVASEVQHLVAAEGPITFFRYMQLALYHPHLGYYTGRVPGRGVSYETSASIGPGFGRLIARELQLMWRALGRPDPFVVTEFGAGLAGLARGAIEAAGPLTDALRWRIVEQFDAIAELQRRSLGPAAGCVEWLRSLDGHPTVGCVLANEVLDNFPFHRFQVSPNGIEEIYVAAEGGRLVELLGPPSSDSLLDHVRPFEGQLVEGHRFEISAGIANWCGQVSREMERGYLLVIDYGDEAPDIWRRGPQGTVSTYGAGQPGTAVLELPGRKDITADVDFTAVDREARAAGFEFELLTLQSYWLKSLGIADEAGELEAEAEMAKAFGWHADARTLLRERDQLLRLVDDKGLGGCLVYRASKGFPPA